MTFLEEKNGKLFVSGKFTRINGVDRTNFAVVDPGTLNIASLQISPTDPLSALAFDGANMFIGGYFNGIYSTLCNGFATIDSATNTIIPWKAVNTIFKENKRTILRGDTLFVLGIADRGTTCIKTYYNAEFRIYNIKTGEELAKPGMNYSKIYDFVLDENYMYASVDNQLRRYSLPSLTRDPSWGVNYGSGVLNLTYLIVQQDSIYSLADNRFVQICTRLPLRKGYLISFDKRTGLPNIHHQYQDKDSIYDDIAFDHGLLDGDKLYVQGYFSVLNGKPRKNFACLNLHTGAITDWKTSFPNAEITNPTFYRTSDLKLHEGAIWFGSASYGNSPLERSLFGGLGAIDTSTGDLISPTFIKLAESIDPFFGYNIEGANDFIIGGSNIVVAGNFNYVNDIPRTNLSRHKITITSRVKICGNQTVDFTSNISGSNYQWQQNAGNGFSNLIDDVHVSGANSGTLHLRNTPATWNGNLYRCIVDGSFSKTFEIVIKADTIPSVSISTISDTVCKNAPVAFKAQIKDSSVITSYQWQVNDVNVGSGTTSFTSASLNDNDKVKLIVTSRRACAIDTVIVSNYINITVKSFLIPDVSIYSTDTNICSGTVALFTASSVKGGTQPLYQWQVNGISAGTNSNVFSSSSLTDGSLVRAIITSNASCLSKAKDTSNVIAVTVKQKLVPSVSIKASLNAICQGDNISFEATAINGGSSPIYQWQVNGSDVGTNSNLFTTNTLKNNEQVKVKLTSNAACTTSPIATSNIVTISVSTKEKVIGQASSPPQVCSLTPFQVNFTSSTIPSGSAIQIWESINGSNFTAGVIQTYNNAPLEYAIPPSMISGIKKYFFTITPPIGNTCSIANNTDTTTTRVDKLIAPVISLNDRVLMVNNSDPGGIYNWQHLQSGIWQNVSPVSNSITYTATDSGAYRVEVIKGMCLEYSNILTILTAVSSQGANELSVYLYPNPVSDILILDSLKFSDNWATLEIIRLDGSTVIAGYNIENQTKVTVNVSFLTNGMYFAVLRTRSGFVKSIKFVKVYSVFKLNQVLS